MDTNDRVPPPRLPWQVELELAEAEQRWTLCDLDLAMERIALYIQYDIEQVGEREREREFEYGVEQVNCARLGPLPLPLFLSPAPLLRPSSLSPSFPLAQFLSLCPSVCPALTPSAHHAHFCMEWVQEREKERGERVCTWVHP